jgi:hypothetical protein
MSVRFSLQTKRMRRVERTLDAIIRAEILENLDLDHTAIRTLNELHSQAEGMVARFEGRDIDEWVGEQQEAAEDAS